MLAGRENADGIPGNLDHPRDRRRDRRQQQGTVGGRLVLPLPAADPSW